MGYQSKNYGKNDLIPQARIKEAQNSLFLINPYAFDVHVISTNYGKQIRGRFTYHGAEYNLRITDPVFEASFKSKSDGEYSINNALLTISLAHDLHEVTRSTQSTGYYKIIAGVILLDDSKN
jgi:hypothetical protein